MTEEISAREASELSGVTYQAITIAIYHGRLKARKINKRWIIKMNDLHEYRKKRYTVANDTRKVNGELIFDNSKGFYSVRQAAKLTAAKSNTVYAAIYYGSLKAKKVRSAWVIHVNDLEKWSGLEIIKKEKYRAD